jgi:hypothetical protein
MTRSPRDLRKQVSDTVGDQLRDLPIQATRFAVMGVGRALMLTDRIRKDVKEVRGGGLGSVLDRLRQDAEHLVVDVVGKVTDHLPAQFGQPDEELPPKRTGPAAGVSTPSPRPTRSTGPARSTGPGRSGANGASRSAGPAAGRSTGPAAGRPVGPAAGRPSTPAADASEISVGKPEPAKPVKPVTKPAEATPKPVKPAAEPPAKPKAATPKPKPAASQDAPVKPVKETAAATAKVAGNTPTEKLPVPNYSTASLASVRARLRNLDATEVGRLRDYERSHANRADFLRMYENRITKLRES